MLGSKFNIAKYGTTLNKLDGWHWHDSYTTILDNDMIKARSTSHRKYNQMYVLCYVIIIIIIIIIIISLVISPDWNDHL